VSAAHAPGGRPARLPAALQTTDASEQNSTCTSGGPPSNDILAVTGVACNDVEFTLRIPLSAIDVSFEFKHCFTGYSAIVTTSPIVNNTLHLPPAPLSHNNYSHYGHNNKQVHRITSYQAHAGATLPVAVALFSVDYVVSYITNFGYVSVTV